MTLSCTELRVKGRASPHFSSLVYCVAANIRPGCVTLSRPPRRTARVRLRGPRSQALPGRPLRRLATTSDEKSGLGWDRGCAMSEFSLVTFVTLASHQIVLKDQQRYA